jgi:hypothetical protein
MKRHEVSLEHGAYATERSGVIERMEERLERKTAISVDTCIVEPDRVGTPINNGWGNEGGSLARPLEH